jgi:hypothetical protein
MKKSKIRLSILLLLVFVIVVSISSGCGEGNDKGTDNGGTSGSSTPSSVTNGDTTNSDSEISCSDMKYGAKVTETAGSSVGSSTDNVNWQSVLPVPPIKVIDPGDFLHTGNESEATVIFCRDNIHKASVSMRENTTIQTANKTEKFLYTHNIGTTYIDWSTQSKSSIPIIKFGTIDPPDVMLRISVTHEEARIAVFQGSATFTPLRGEEMPIEAGQELVLAPGGVFRDLIKEPKFTEEEIRIFEELSGLTLQ